jgi:NADP-dependent 3-hydroxy acid dehydrogenase YdfG
VNNAGIFYTKPFTEFTTQDFNTLASTNLLGFLYITQLAVKQMLKQKSGNVVNISASLAEHPIAGVKCVGFDDHQGWSQCNDPKSRNGLRKGRYPF